MERPLSSKGPTTVARLDHESGRRRRVIAVTQKACLDNAETERGFRAAFKSASRWKMEGNRLELFDAAGVRVAAFAAGSPSTTPNANALQGTAWQLVKFQGSDGTTLTPDDRGKYTSSSTQKAG